MRLRYPLTILFFVFTSNFLFCQSLSEEEKQLAILINEYRKSKGLPELAVSKSLTTVAQAHCRDLQKYHKRMKFFRPNINAHSWSRHGKWNKLLYYPDHRNAVGMWSKPREFTPYKGDGFEIAASDGGGNISPQQAIGLWKGSTRHNAVMINKNDWKDVTWDCIGIGMIGSYACVWFGQEKDPEGYF